MRFPGLRELPRPRRALENKSRAEKTAVSLCAPTVAAHAMGLRERSSEVAPSAASPGGAPPVTPAERGARVWPTVLMQIASVMRTKEEKHTRHVRETQMLFL